ncbi:hypothetical protein AWQ21_15635 (plasmid) [Picosynechococcus sp. PCC 7003]|uniref:prefoldin domain-containing protein n=1 Tax=Picosynechococcus sp. PCC 7003 TaxID=374981 RepID=UPI0008108A83|nr:prefoldin domain-containing protein [Picosynechococcus sp. PCC 7003]ANV85953.1 hypothetical protein AWQ21_15635 [Picosynechococcus sp. PCC 7003]
MKMKKFKWLLILLLVTGNLVSCGPRNHTENPPSPNDIGSPADTGEEGDGNGFPLGYVTFIALLLLAGGIGLFSMYIKVNNQKNNKSNKYTKNSRPTSNISSQPLRSNPSKKANNISGHKFSDHLPKLEINELLESLDKKVETLVDQNQKIEQQLQKLEKQITSISSQNSLSSSRFSERQQYPVQDKTNYSNYPVHSQPAPVVQRDPYQEVITAFNTKDTTFFQQNTTYYLALDESTIGGETSAGAKRIVKFIDIDNLRDALCLAVNVNSEYLLIPNFFSPYYENLDQWLSDNIDIFDYQGNGQTVELIRPGKVQYSQSENGIWNLIEPVRLQLS